MRAGTGQVSSRQSWGGADAQGGVGAVLVRAWLVPNPARQRPLSVCGRCRRTSGVPTRNRRGRIGPCSGMPGLRVRTGSGGTLRTQRDLGHWVKRSPLNRGTKGLKRTGMPRGSGPSRVSAKRSGEATERRRVWAIVERRDNGCRLAHRGDCFGRLTPHHLLKASAGGAFSEDNIVVLCAGCNDWVEDHPLEATALGMVRRASTEVD